MKFETRNCGPINIIFLHGWGAGKDSFLWLSDYLTNYKLHFASLDGFDGTDAPNDPTISGYADRLDKYIKANKLDNVVLVGHSFGGRIAIEYCSKHDILGLILVDSAGIKPKYSFKKHFSVLKYKLLKKLVKFKLAKKERLKKYGSTDYKNCNQDMKQVFLNSISYDQTKLLNKIKTQTLLIWGKNDKETPLYMAKKLNKNIKNSELVVIDGEHFCFLQNPYGFYKIVEAFVSQLT